METICGFVSFACYKRQARISKPQIPKAPSLLSADAGVMGYYSEPNGFKKRNHGDPQESLKNHRDPKDSKKEQTGSILNPLRES